MTTETINFIVGWLTGLISSSISILIGYRIQLKSEERQRKHAVISRRLDQTEQNIDLIMESANEILRYMSLKKGRAESVDAALKKLFANLSSVYSAFVIEDEELWVHFNEMRELMEIQTQLFDEYAEDGDQQDAIARQRELIQKFNVLNIKAKRRIDVLRTADPSFYIK